LFRLPKDTEMTIPLLEELLRKHANEVTSRFEKLRKGYIGDHDILHAPKKAPWKPDNRIVVNFPKYIVDTMNGFFIGNPIKIIAKDESVAKYVEHLDQYNDQDDNNAELSKICLTHGRGYEMYYTDEEAEQCITYLSPIEAFMVYDDSIVERPMFFVRRYTDNDNIEHGSISNVYGVRHFTVTGGLRWTDVDWTPHYFKGVPATEYMANDERIGIFEPIMSNVNAYNKAISEKANDVDYFADAYLKVLGAQIEDDDLKFIRDNRVINLYGEFGEGGGGISADFMDKPNNDASQEHLIDRLERLIFQNSMVANISDEKFGTASGIALQYKLLAMNNLAKTMIRKFTSGMNRRYKLLFGHPASKVPADAWLDLDYQFTPNIPANLLEEAQIAAQMEGVTSHKTQLKVLSIVDNVQEELDTIEEENAPDENTIVDRSMFPNMDDGEAGGEDITDNAGGGGTSAGQNT